MSKAFVKSTNVALASLSQNFHLPRIQSHLADFLSFGIRRLLYFCSYYECLFGKYFSIIFADYRIYGYYWLSVVWVIGLAVLFICRAWSMVFFSVPAIFYFPFYCPLSRNFGSSGFFYVFFFCALLVYLIFTVKNFWSISRRKFTKNCSCSFTRVHTERES